jgi:hypothetical protein
LFIPVFGQLNYPEISEEELENYEYTTIYEEPNGNYKIVVVDGITYIVYY